MDSPTDAIRAAEVDYGEKESTDLRAELIAIRDEVLGQNNFKWAVILTHVIAWMAVVIEERWP